MFCPRCTSPIRRDSQSAYCEATRAGLSASLYEGLLQRCVARTADSEDSRLSFVVGGRWFCPGCTASLREEQGRLECPACGCCLNRFVRDLVEFYVHPPFSAIQGPPELNPLIRAAMYGETEVARAISRHSPAMRAALGANGESPAQLALAAGHIGTAVALLRSDGIAPPQAASLLEASMSELSETIACAAWLDNLEHLLWHVSRSDSPLPEHVDLWGFGHIVRPVGDDLRWLSDLSGGWFHFPNEKVEFIPIADWLPLHDSWKSRWPTSS